MNVMTPSCARPFLSVVMLCFVCGTAAAGNKADAKASAAGARAVAEVAASATMASSAEGQALRAAWVQADHQFTPKVKAAYLAFAKAQAERELATAGKTLPADFLAWVDGDPVVAAQVAGERDLKDCRQVAGRITAAGTQIKDPAQTRPWLEGLAKIIAGREEFTPKNAKKNARPQRDPCADAIAQLRAPPPAPAK